MGTTIVKGGQARSYREGGWELEHQRPWEYTCRHTRQANTFCAFTAPAGHKLQYLLHTDGICSRVRFSFLKNTEIARARVLTATITETEAKLMILTETLAETKATLMILTEL